MDNNKYQKYPYYKLFKADISKLIGLTGVDVIIQKKYPDDRTISITSDDGKIFIGNKKEMECNKCLIVKLDEDFFHRNDNLIFYGSILNKTIVLWDAWDKYNKVFVDSEKHITKYRAKENYRGKFDIKLLDIYKNHIYRFIYPRLTYYV